MTISPTHAPLRAPSRRSLPLQWVLPLLITAVVTGVLVTGLALSSAVLRRAAITAARSTLASGVRQLASVSTTNVQQARSRYLAAANDSAVHWLLRGEPRAAIADTVRRTLSHLTTGADSGRPIELWKTNGQRVALVGLDSATTIDVRPRSELPDQAIVLRTGVDRLRAIDSIQLGSLYADNGRVYFWLVMAVLEHGRPVGYIAQQRQVAAPPQTSRTLRELTGTPINAYYGNVDRKFWSTIGGQPAKDPHRSGDGTIEAEANVAGTPLMLALETPRSAVLASTNALIGKLALLAVGLTVAGALLAWIIGRRVAKPIVALTSAAESVALGNYETRVPSGGPQEIARLAASFNEMSRRVGVASAQLAAASRAKSEFLATMSHELRTPLNAIGGYVDLLELELRGPLTEAQQRDLVRIRTNQQHLLGLIGGVLDFSRIESGRITYELGPIAVDQLLSGLDVLIAPQAEAKSLALEYAGAPQDLVVMADREKLRQILLNLLSNAIRNTPSGGRITMEAVGRESLVELSVRDTGPGIPLNKQTIIFEPFVQLDRSLIQTREGVGLGLSISRDLATGMSGKLTVDSSPGAGACFTVSLPRGKDEMLPMQQTAERSITPVRSRPAQEMA